MTDTPWNSQLVEIRSREQAVFKAFAPLLKHRWPLFAKTPTNALKKLSQLPLNTVQAIFEYLYANTPVSRTNLPAFKTCKIIDKLPYVSTYHTDLINLLHDQQSCDFTITGTDPTYRQYVHKFMIYCRSNYFKQKIADDFNYNTEADPNMSPAALEMFAQYLYVGDFEIIDVPALVELLGSGKRYKLRDQDEIDFLAQSAIRENINDENAAAVLERARALERPEIINLVEDRFIE